MHLTLADRVHGADVYLQFAVSDAMDVALAFEEHDFVETVAVKSGRTDEVSVLEALDFDWKRGRVRNPKRQYGW